MGHIADLTHTRGHTHRAAQTDSAELGRDRPDRATPPVPSLGPPLPVLLFSFLFFPPSSCPPSSLLLSLPFLSLRPSLSAVPLCARASAGAVSLSRSQLGRHSSSSLSALPFAAAGLTPLLDQPAPVPRFMARSRERAPDGSAIPAAAAASFSTPASRRRPPR